MITSLLHNDHESEAKQINIILKDLAAKLTEEKWNILNSASAEELLELLEDKPLVDLFMYDIKDDEGVERLLDIRDDYQLAQLLILADPTLSPMKYIKPGINAQALLIRPFTKEQAYSTISDFIQDYVRKTFGDKKDDRASILVESREGKVSVPYDQIYYIEAMEKKVYVCTGAEEYGFYGTLDGLLEMLPDNFLRCHRSFIVNSNKIRKVALSKNTIYLSDDYEVPLSRSYKATLKEIDNG